MRLLILTQAVDLDDPVLGFFHRWIVEFAKRFDTIEVICLKAGDMICRRTYMYILSAKRTVGHAYNISGISIA